MAEHGSEFRLQPLAERDSLPGDNKSLSTTPLDLINPECAGADPDLDFPFYDSDKNWILKFDVVLCARNPAASKCNKDFKFWFKGTRHRFFNAKH